ncbi:MAG TPA: CYCYC family (seleno)protein, partial [bacterium]|nr:CYCYC family (seleno)protein [bacterium]
TCDVCIEEAEMASQMHKKGATPQEIQKAIDRQFS